MGVPPTVFSSAQIQQLSMMGSQQMAPPPIWPTLMQGLMYGPQTPAGLHAAQQMGPAVLGALISPQTPILGALTQGAMGRAGIMQAVGQIAFPGGGGPTGQGFGFQERDAIFQSVRQQQVLPQATLGELSQIIGAGTQMGAFQATRTVQDFKQKFTELLNAVKSVTTTLGTSLQESLALMQQVRGMGLFGTTGAGALNQIQGAAYATGMSPLAMMQGMQAALPGMAQAGIRGPQAAGAALGGMRTFATAYNMGILDPESVYGATGLAPEQGGLQAMNAQFLQRMSYRMRHTSRGSWLTAAMLDPETGGVDQEMLAGLRSGTLGLGELQSQASRRAGQYGQANWVANRGKMASNMMQAEPYAEMMMYRNVLQSRGVEDMTSSQGRIILGRLTGMDAEEVTPFAEMLQNLDKIRIEEQVNTVRARRASTSMAQRTQAGGPEFMRGFQERLQGWASKLEDKGAEVQKTLEQVMLERLGGEVASAETWLAQPIAEIMFRPGSQFSNRVRGLVSQYGTPGTGGGAGGAGGAGWAYGRVGASGLTDPSQLSSLRTQQLMFRPETYLAGATGDVNSAMMEARERLSRMSMAEKDRLNEAARAGYAALEEINANNTGRLISALPPDVVRTLTSTQQELRGMEQPRTPAERIVQQTRRNILSRRQRRAVGEMIAGGFGGATEDQLERVTPSFGTAGDMSSIRFGDLENFYKSGRLDQFGGMSEEVQRAVLGGLGERGWQGSVMGKEVSLGRGEISQVVGEASAFMRREGGEFDQTKFSGLLQRGLQAKAAEKAFGHLAGGLAGAAQVQEAGLGFGAFAFQELVSSGGLEARGANEYQNALLNMFNPTVGAGGSRVYPEEMSLSQIKGFLRSTSSMSGKMFELTGKGGALAGETPDSLLSEAKGKSPKDASPRQLFMSALEGKGLSQGEIQQLLETDAIRSALSRGGDPDTNVRDALNRTLMVGSGNAVVGYEDVAGITKTLFGADRDQVQRLEGMASKDPSLRGLVGALRGLAGDVTDPNQVGKLVSEVYSSSDPKEQARRLGALAGAGYQDALAVVEGAGQGIQRLERAGRRRGRRGMDARREALLDVLGNVTDVSGLKGADTTALVEAARAAGLGGDGVDIQKYLESGEGLERGALGEQVGGVFARFAAGMRSQEDKAKQQETENQAAQMAKAIAGIKWTLTFGDAPSGGASPAGDNAGAGASTTVNPANSNVTGAIQAGRSAMAAAVAFPKTATIVGSSGGA